MPANLDDIVIDISVLLSGSPVTRAGFGTPFIGGPNSAFAASALVLAFTSLAAVVDGTGLTTADPEYLAAQAMFGSGISRIKIGTLPDRVAQVDTFTIGTAADGDWVLSIGDVDYTFTASGDNEAAIAAGLRALVDADGTGVVNDSGAGAEVILTAKIAGRAFTATLVAPGSGANSKVSTTANVDLATGLNAIVSEDGDWYGMVLTSRVEEDILQAAAWVEAQKRLFIAQSADTAIGTSATDDVASLLQDSTYGRTALIFHQTSSARADAAWLANRLQADPDATSTTWANTTLAGVAVDTLSATQRDLALAKKANVYLPLFGVAITHDGTLASGKYIDERFIADWLEARLGEDCAQAIIDASARRSKIPYTPGGFAVFESIVRARYAQGVRVGHFADDSLTLTIPTPAQLVPADQTARIFRFSGSLLLAGAIHRIQFSIAANAA